MELLTVVKGTGLILLLTSPGAWWPSQRLLSFFIFRMERGRGWQEWADSWPPPTPTVKVAVSVREL